MPGILAVAAHPRHIPHVSSASWPITARPRHDRVPSAPDDRGARPVRRARRALDRHPGGRSRPRTARWRGATTPTSRSNRTPSAGWPRSTPPGASCATRPGARRGTARTPSSRADATGAASPRAAAIAPRPAAPRTGAAARTRTSHAPGQRRLAPRAPAGEGAAGPPPGNPRGSVLPFGRHIGWSIGEIARIDPGYLAWLQPRREGEPYREEIERSLAALRVDAGRPGAGTRPQARPVPLTAVSRLERGDERRDPVERVRAAPA